MQSKRTKKQPRTRELQGIKIGHHPKIPYEQGMSY